MILALLCFTTCEFPAFRFIWFICVWVAWNTKGLFPLAGLLAIVSVIFRASLLDSAGESISLVLDLCDMIFFMVGIVGLSHDIQPETQVNPSQPKSQVRGVSSVLVIVSTLLGCTWGIGAQLDGMVHSPGPRTLKDHISISLQILTDLNHLEPKIDPKTLNSWNSKDANALWALDSGHLD